MTTTTPATGLTLAVAPIADGVELRIEIPQRAETLIQGLDRSEARRFAHAILAAAGDGTERTFKPEER